MNHQQSTPSSERSPRPLSQLYFQPISETERQRRALAHEQRRLESRPQWSAWRVSSWLSGGIFLLFLGVQAAHVAFQTAGPFTLVSCSFLWLLGTVYYYSSAAREVDRLFSYRNLSPSQFWITYSAVLTVASAAGSLSGVLTMGFLLSHPWASIIVFPAVHFGVGYGLAGIWVGYGRR